MNGRRFLLFLWMGILQFFGVEALPSSKKWVVYFAENLPVEVYKPYSLLILEGGQHPDLAPLLEREKTVLGYLSLGEVSQDRDYYPELEREGILLEANSNWPDSRMVDVRSPLWTERVVEQLIPALLFARFSGVFLDTVDNPSYLEEKEPEKYKGMRKALIRLIKTIRLHYPNMPIMMNRGFSILKEVANEIDMVLAENILIDYNFKTNTSHFVPKEQYRRVVRQLKEAQKVNPKLEIFTLDYWDPDEKEIIKKIYKIQRASGFHPYVSTLYLDQIIPEPS